MWRAVLAILLFVSPASATAFTSNCAGPCNWNAGASWTGGSGSNFPGMGDTAAITGQQIVIVPSSTSTIGVTITYGAGISSAYTKVIVNGTLMLGGNATLAAFSEIDCGSGATFDLNGNNVAPASGAAKYSFNGTAGSHCVVKSSVNATGGFLSTSQTILSTHSYTDFSGLADSYLGRGNSSGTCQTYSYVTFTNMALVAIDFSGGANDGATLSHVDFRDPSPANPYAVNAYQPEIDFGATALGTCARTNDAVTWSRSSPTPNNVGVTFMREIGGSLTNSVSIDWAITTLGSFTFQNSYQSMHVVSAGPSFSLGGEVPPIFTGVYIYAQNAAAHPYSPQGDLTLTVTGSVFENTTTSGLKWFLYGPGTTASITMHNNIFLGLGSAIDFDREVGNSALTPTFLFYNNTYYGDQLDHYEGTAAATLMRVDHPGGTLTGTQVEFYNNLTAKPNVSTAQNQLVTLQLSDANQVTYADYNTDFGFPSTVYSPATIYSSGCPMSGCALAYSATITVGGNATYGVNYATHDFSADPQFVDRTRNVATWDSSLGGPGTEAHAIAEMLKVNGTGGTFNAAYTPSALVTWVRAGFVPHNAAFHNTGRTGNDIGAMPWAAAAVTGGIVQ